MVKVLALDESGPNKIQEIDLTPLDLGQFEAYLATDVPGASQSTTFFDYLAGNIDLPEDGDYLVTVSFIWSLNNTQNDFRSRLLIGGATFYEQQQEPKDAGGAGITVNRIDQAGTLNTGTNQRHLGTFQNVLVGATAGVTNFQLQLAGSANNHEACMYQGSIVVRRIG